MKDINKILCKANIYSIEYSGFFTLKFSLSPESILYSLNNELIIEFVAGIILLKDNKALDDIKSNIFDIFGLCIEKINLDKQKILKINLEQGFTIKSVTEDNDLIDRNWVIRSYDNNSYIINDSSDLFYSENLKN